MSWEIPGDSQSDSIEEKTFCELLICFEYLIELSNICLIFVVRVTTFTTHRG